MYKKGFTLAEVLTTLMVIGVVAAMTIPTLMNSTNDQQLKVAYKKAVSVLSQGIQLMVAKEVECRVQTSYDLADCFAKNVLKGTSRDGVVTTSDGMVYKFLYKGNIDNQERSLDDICGKASDLFNDDNLNGVSSSCAVVVDLNGLSKGAKAIPEPNGNNIRDMVLSMASEMGTEQLPIMIAGNGVRPMYFSGADDLQAAYNVTAYDVATGQYKTTRVEKSTFEKLDQGWKWMYK